VAANLSGVADEGLAMLLGVLPLIDRDLFQMITVSLLFCIMRNSGRQARMRLALPPFFSCCFWSVSDENPFSGQFCVSGISQTSARIAQDNVAIGAR
jgi:hypothetical protein